MALSRNGKAARFPSLRNPLLFKRGDFRIVFIIGAVGVLAIAWFLGLNREQTVLITDDGWQPAMLAVSPGTKVVFKNRGQNPHWPASNAHPTHTLYPQSGGCIGSALDACRALQPGESFSFIFEHEGQWPMHDHLYPGLVMVVEVRPDPGLVPRAQTLSLEGQSVGYEAFRSLDYARQLAIIKDQARSDPAEAWDYLRLALKINGATVGNPHEFSHIIGNQLYNQYGIAGVGVCDESFAFGCFHGVTEQYLQIAGRDGVWGAEQKCAEIFSTAPSELKLASCLHGIGHGLLSWNSRDLGLALADCDLLEAAHRSYCFDGVFMENAQEFSGDSDPGEAWRFCENLATGYQPSCARYLVQAVFKNTVEDWSEMGQFCILPAAENLKQICAESAGYLTAQFYFGEAEKVAAACSDVPSGAIGNLCVIGAAQEIIFQKYSDWEQTAENLCQSLETFWQAQCLARIQAIREKL